MNSISPFFRSNYFKTCITIYIVYVVGTTPLLWGGLPVQKGEVYFTHPDSTITYERQKADLDSILIPIYQKEGIDYVEEKIGLPFLLNSNVFGVKDSLRLFECRYLSFCDLNFYKFYKRNELLRGKLLPLGYKEEMDVSFSFIGPRWEEEFTYHKAFWAIFIGWIFNGMFINPIMFICLPVGICFLIFSRKARRQFKLFIGKICRRIRSWVDRIRRK